MAAVAGWSNIAVGEPVPSARPGLISRRRGWPAAAVDDIEDPDMVRAVGIMGAAGAAT
jgi:hypothetical protein